MRAIASGDERRGAALEAAIGVPQSCGDVIAALVELDELERALDGDTAVAQRIDEELLVFVLWEDEGVWVRTDLGTHVTEEQTGDVLTGDPDVRGRHGAPAGNNRVGQSDLTVELERASLDREGA
jgi:hypothetical protein